MQLGVTTGAGEYAPMPPVLDRCRRHANACGPGWWQVEARCAITHHDETGLFAGEKVLDHHPRAGAAKAVVEQHRFDRLLRFCAGLRHHHALPAASPSL